MGLRRLWRRWQLAGCLAAAERDGRTVVDIPDWLAPEVAALRWTRSVERAEAKWSARTSDVSVEDWAAAARRRRPDRYPPGC